MAEGDDPLKRIERYKTMAGVLQDIGQGTHVPTWIMNSREVLEGTEVDHRSLKFYGNCKLAPEFRKKFGEKFAEHHARTPVATWAHLEEILRETLTSQVTPLVDFSRVMAIKRNESATLADHFKKFKAVLETTRWLNDPDQVEPYWIVCMFQQTCYQSEREAMQLGVVENWEDYINSNLNVMAAAGKAAEHRRAQPSAAAAAAAAAQGQYAKRPRAPFRDVVYVRDPSSGACNNCYKSHNGACYSEPRVGAVRQDGTKVSAPLPSAPPPPPPTGAPTYPKVSLMLNRDNAETHIGFTCVARFLDTDAVALFDTGASINLVSEAFLASAGRRAILSSSSNPLSLAFADSSQTIVDTVIQDVVWLWDNEYTFEAYVCPLPAPIELIIGAQFIRANALSIDGQTGTVSDSKRTARVDNAAVAIRDDWYQIPFPKHEHVSVFSAFSASLAQVNKVRLCLPIFITPEVENGAPERTFADLLRSITVPKLRDIVIPYEKLFSDTLPVFDEHNYPLRYYMNIELTDPRAIPSSKYRPMSHERTERLIAEVRELEAKGYIVRSNSPYTSPPMWVEDGGKRRLVFDFGKINLLTVECGHPVPTSEELFAKFAGKTIYSSFDMTSSFMQARINPEHIKYASFPTPIGVFSHKTCAFGLKNSGRHFMMALSALLAGMDFTVIFVDDIAIASQSDGQHAEHLKLFLARAAELGITLKLKKTRIGVRKLKFLGHIIEQGTISPDPEKVSLLQAWPVPQNQTEMRGFLGLFNWFRKFLRHAAEIIIPLTELTKKDIQFHMDERALQAFAAAKQALAGTLILRLPQPHLGFDLYTDASRLAVGACLLQADYPVNFYSKKLSSAEQRYSVRDQEFFAIYCALRTFKSYLLGAPFRIFCDHKTLIFLQTQQERTERQMRWLTELACFGQLNITYIKGETNVIADYLSRAHIPQPVDDPDVVTILAVTRAQTAPIRACSEVRSSSVPSISAIRADGPGQMPVQPMEVAMASASNAVTLDAVRPPQVLPAVEITVTEFSPDSDLIEEIKQASAHDALMAGWETRNPLHFKWFDGILYHSESGNFELDSRMCIPAANARIVTRILAAHHDAVMFAHRGARTTFLMLRRNFFWIDMRKDVDEYVKSCESCQKNKYPTRRSQGMLQQIQPAPAPWDTITIDFVTSLPVDPEGFDEIMVVIDKLTKRAFYIPSKSTFTSADVADNFLTHCVAYRGLPRKIISDRDVKFSAQHWSQLMANMGCQLAMSVSGRAEADGQTERAIRTLREAMRHYVSEAQTNWRKLLPWLQLAYNQTPSASTGFSPMALDCGFEPRLPMESPIKLLPAELEIQEHFNRIVANIASARDSITRSFDDNARQFNKYRDPCKFKVNDWVLVHNKCLTALSERERPSKKMAAQLAGPFQISSRIGPNTFKLHLPISTKVNNAFNAEHLVAYTCSPDRFDTRPRSRITSHDEDGEPMYTVECLSDRRMGTETGVEYLVKYLDYSDAHSLWMERNNLMESIPDMVASYDDAHPLPSPPSQPLALQGGGDGQVRRSGRPSKRKGSSSPPLVAEDLL